MKKLSVIYLNLAKDSAFVVEGLNRDDVEIITLELRKKIIFKILYHLCLFFHFYKFAARFHFLNGTYSKLIGIENDLLFFDCCRINEYIVITKLIRTGKKHLFLWNPLALNKLTPENIKKHLVKLKNNKVNIYTFDPADSVTYQLTLVKNVNRKYMPEIKPQIKQDFYFLGLPKNREPLLNEIKFKLNEKGYKTNFIIVNSKDDYISFEDNIVNSLQSLCIVDIISDMYQQSGLTLRPLDALFLQKKIITNCQSIVNYDFYHPNNIYIISDSLDGIDEFMNKPYFCIPENIVNQYEINYWIEQFIG